MMYGCSPGRAGRAPVVKRKGKSLRVDLHCHYLNPEVAAKLAGRDPGQHEPAVKFANALTRETNARQARDIAPKLSSIEARLKAMDRMGVDIQAISPAPNQLIYWTEAGEGQALARQLNERIAEICGQWPERFVGLGTVPLQNAELAVQELHYGVKHLGLRGVEIHPNVNGLDLTNEKLRLDKFFAKAEQLGIVIFMHPLGFTQGERLVDHYFNNVIGNPLETTVAASHLIFDGVMERYPKLKVVLPHAGGYLAHYWARMDHAWRARPDCRVSIKKKPSGYLEKFYFDTITFDRGMLRNLVERFGAEHVVLGTDYPYDMGMADPVAFIDGLKLPAADKARIMGGNAARLLGLGGSLKSPRADYGYNKLTRRRTE